MTVKITPEFLENLRQTATNCQPPVWRLDDHSDVISDHHKVAMCNFSDDAQHIAAADPATVLALVTEIERLTSELQEKQRLIDKLCEAERNRWESAVKAFGIRSTESEVSK
jgi:DNA polymerase sigma